MIHFIIESISYVHSILDEYFEYCVDHHII